MKKKILLIVSIVLIIIAVLSTIIIINQNKGTDSINANKVNNDKTLNSKNPTAEEIINMMKEKNENIGKIVVYNEETDWNNLLGRPNQYTSKIQFADNRLDQSYIEEDNAKGGTIEVFSKKEDLENRKNYIENLSSNASIFVQYIYSKNYALLRLDKDITPEQAKEYEEVFYEVLK